MKYFTKKAIAVDTSNHFLERMFGRPKVKKSYNRFEGTFNAAGGHDKFLEDIPELKQLLFYKGKQRLVYIDKETGAKYVLDFMQDKETGKHKLVVVTGMEDYMNTSNTLDITDKINLLSSRSR